MNQSPAVYFIADSFSFLARCIRLNERNHKRASAAAIQYVFLMKDPLACEILRNWEEKMNRTPNGNAKAIGTQLHEESTIVSNRRGG